MADTISMELTDQELSGLRSGLGLSDLQVHFLEAQAADDYDKLKFRKHIRAEIAKALQADVFISDLLSSEDLHRLQDLEVVPKLAKIALSISHSGRFGVFAYSAEAPDLGIDIESVDRINLRIVDRVSSSDEVSLSPGLAYLWAAKESSFKALFSDPPQTISEIRVEGWQRQDRDLHAFTAKSSHSREIENPVRGLCLQKDCLILSISRI